MSICSPWFREKGRLNLSRPSRKALFLLRKK